MTTILVADPDRRSRLLISAALRYAGYETENTRSLDRAASYLRRRRLDAVVLDPAEREAAEIVSSLRAVTEVPIIVVSTTEAETHKVAILDAGADDYLTKPFGVEEFLARLRVGLRRAPRSEPLDLPIVTRDFTIHLADRRWVRSDHTEARLTPIEWRLVEVLVRRAGHLVSQAELLHAVWGPKAAGKTYYLRVQITAIRRKVEPDPSRPRYFLTAPGLGLRFDPNAVDHLQPC